MEVVYPVACHTDNVGPGSTFVAIPGTRYNGIDYVAIALARGACRIVVEQNAALAPDLLALIENSGTQLVYVDNARKALAQLSAEAHGYPAKKLKFVGITGTKGKSTSSYLLEQVLRTAGYKTALLSTVKNKILETEYAAPLTTAQPDYLNTFFAHCVQQGVEWVVMEVAAQAVTLHRVEGIVFNVLIFTNFSREHGEFYSSMNDYFSAKKALFSQAGHGALCFFNADDQRVGALSKEFPGSVLFGLDNPEAGCRAQMVGNSLASLRLSVEKDGHYAMTLECPSLIGTFNAYNVLGVASCALALGIALADIQKALIDFAGVPGRLTKYALPNGATAFIDYAHTPSSVEAVLSTLRPMTHNLIVVSGAGGERDKDKRPIMGMIMATYADSCIFTSDNPRSEEPADIVQALIAGISPEDSAKVLIELDREMAIRRAYERSSNGSIIALLGKGPDEYQLIRGVKIPFSERAILGSL